MTRLASTAKAGFFPTPERVTEWIASAVRPLGEPGKLLDPCCGKGIAAETLAHAWNLEAFGVEIDAERALEAGGRLHRVLHLDYESVRAPHDAFDVLFLNPPYDYAEGEGRRLEYMFLRDTTKWLAPDGLLVYIVPQYRVDARISGYITTFFRSPRIYRFPDPEYDSFQQIVLFASKKKLPLRDDPIALNLLKTCRGELPILPEQWIDEDRIQLARSDESRFYFRGTGINPKDAVAEAIAAGVWNSREWHDWISPNLERAPFRPVMPLKKGHLAMLIAAGLMRNLQLDSPDGTERLLVKGRTYKVQDKVESDDDNEEVVRDRFVTEIVALDLDIGTHAKIQDPTALSSFVETWRDILARKVMETFVPLYQFDLDAQGSQVQTTLNRLSQHRYLPGRSETGLFAAQKHVAVALWSRLRESKSAILVGEMGTGKTTCATAISELLRQCSGQLGPTLVLCPPHLVSKWVRELRQIVPMAFAMALYRLTDVTLFTDQVKRLAPRTPAFAVLSREMAKLGSGWRPAYVLRKSYSRVETRDGSEDIETQEGFACPRCGKEVWYVEAGTETSPVRDPEYFAERKRKCFACAEPFFQSTHLDGVCRALDDSQGNSARLIDSATTERKLTPRYPIADYIARRHRGFFKLLIADEVHQMKGQSTDQGYALGALVRACTKTIALTGTIYGGRATSLFFLLHRLSPDVRARFRWSEAQRWAERYGILERVTKKSEGETGYGTYSGKRRRQTHVRELPGASPELAALLLDSTAFLTLNDLGFQLPDFREHAHEIEMAPDQREAYDELEDELTKEVKVRLRRGDQSLLGAYLQSLLAYPNSCFRAEYVTDSHGEFVAEARALVDKRENEDRLFPKEEWLVKLAKDERSRGRRVLVFCRQTGTRDITDRLSKILGRAGLRAEVLKASVGTRGREEWLRRRVGKSMIDVLLTNPRLVETGLDLVDFHTTVWFEIEYSLYTLMQASRRTWRIGQTQNVDVHYVVYRDSMEHRAASLVGKKLAAALLLYGDSVEGALLAQSDSGRGFLADLARNVIEGAQVEDLSQLFRQVASSAGKDAERNEYIGSTITGGAGAHVSGHSPDLRPRYVAPDLYVTAKQMALL